MLSRAETKTRAKALDVVTRSFGHSAQWALDRSVSIGYGMVYDSIFEGFRPYRALQTEVLGLVEASVPEGVERRDVRIMEIGCGPGNFSCLLAEAGFSVVGIDPYSGLIELAREKRRAKRLPHLAFQHADLTAGSRPWPSAFDQIVSVHFLYAHPMPQRVLEEAHKLLSPGGHAVFVNHTRRIGLRSVRAVWQREGLGAALRSLRWVIPNMIFETGRKRVGPSYWSEDECGRAMRRAGFTVLAMRRTFFDEA